MSKTHINWGILGCARIAAKAVIPGIQIANNAVLYAIAGKTKGKLDEFKERYNPQKAYDNYEALLDDPQVDAVYIPLPNSLHLEWVRKAAEKKKHILCEKPLVCTADEVLEMKAACEKNGVHLMEAFAFRHSPLTFKVKELADSGIIGKMKLIESNFSFPLHNLGDIRMVRELGGGATYDVGCYNISVIRFIAGQEPVSVYATGEIGEKSGVDESSICIMEFKGGLKGISHCAFNCASRSEYRIVGENGIIDVPERFNAKGECRIIIRKEGTEEVIKVDTPDNYALEVEQLGRCILNGEKPLLSLEESYNNAVVIDKVLKQIFG